MDRNDILREFSAVATVREHLEAAMMVDDLLVERERKNYELAIIDSGASRSIFRHEHSFVPSSLKPCYVGICTANAHRLVATQLGTVRLQVASENGKQYTLELHDTLHIPEMQRDLISVKSLLQHKTASVHFMHSHAYPGAHTQT